MRPIDRSRALERHSRYEMFEERLALTAQPVGDVSLGMEQQLQQHYGELARAEVVSPIGDFQLETIAEERISPFATTYSGSSGDVHDSTGVNYVFNNYGLTGAGQTVAVIDSGIAWDHVALGGGLGSDYRVVGGYDFAEGDDDPYDDGPSGFHGTHVAGIIGSSDAEHRGVAPGVDLVGLRVFDDNGAGYFSWVEDALQWVHDNRNEFENPITTVNLSLGTSWNADSTPAWSTLEDEFAQLEADGIFIAVSAGNSFGEYNSAGLSYPAASSYVVPVASIDSDASISEFSQRSDRVLAAPGSYITSTIPDHVFGADGDPNDFGTSSGTSMASPYVAGASVLVREAMEFAGFTNITQDTIYEHLRNTADIIYDAATNANYRLINLEAAISALMPSDDFGSTSGAAYSLGTLSSGSSFAGVIGNTTDADYFRFTAGQTGQATFSFDTTYELTLDAKIVGGSGSFTGDNLTIDVIAGQSYTIALSTTDGIGQYAANVTLANANDGGSQSSGSGSNGEGEVAVDPLAKAAYELDQSKGLNFSGKDYLNWGGTNEKWLQGNDGWYFIRPGGEVYKWSGAGKANGSLVATLDAGYYADLSKIYDAEEPATCRGGGVNTGAETETGDAANKGGESTSDTNGETGDSTSGTESTLVARARELDAKFGFSTDGKYYENWAGQGEKWFRSQELGWVFITPDGSVYDWNGNQGNALESPKIAQLDVAFHQDPTLLTDPPADTGASEGDQNDANGGSSGSSADSSKDSGQGKSNSGSDTSNGNTLAKRAYEIDQQLGLRSTGDYYHNWAKLGEKWMTSAYGQWYFITADGSFYRWNGSQADAASSELIAKLDASFHTDPSKLHSAPSSNGSIGVNSASVPTLGVEDTVTVIDTRSSMALDAQYASNSHRTLARNRALGLSSDSQVSVTDEVAAVSKSSYFAEYERSSTVRYHDGFRAAPSQSLDDETVIDRVYQALETDSTTHGHTEVSG